MEYLLTVTKEDLKEMIDAHIILLWIREWWISLTGGFTSFVSAWFGSGVLLFLDPDLANDFAKGITALAGALIAFTTLIYTVRKRRKEESKIEQDMQQDRDSYYLLQIKEGIKALDEMGVFKGHETWQERVVVAKEYLKLTVNKTI